MSFQGRADDKSTIQRDEYLLVEKIPSWFEGSNQYPKGKACEAFADASGARRQPMGVTPVYFINRVIVEGFHPHRERTHSNFGVKLPFLQRKNTSLLIAPTVRTSGDDRLSMHYAPWPMLNGAVVIPPSGFEAGFQPMMPWRVNCGMVLM